MNTSKYRALVETVKCGSFYKAAGKLGYTQSGLTHMMNSLEKDVGFKIVERGHFGVRLTNAGEKLYSKILDLLHASDSLEKEIDNIRKHNITEISVGAYSSIILNWLPSIISMYNEKYSHVKINIETGGAEELYQGLISGRYDMVFASKDSKPWPAEWIPLKNDKMLAVLPENYSAYGESFDIKRFDGEKFLMPGYGIDVEIEKALSHSGVTPQIVPTALDDPYIISMVEYGLGISMLTELVLLGRDDRVKTLPITPQAHRELGIALYSSKMKRSDITDFIHTAKKYLKI